jgi:hypothetical protein
VGGHADYNASAFAAVKHYDDTKSAVVDVVAGEDQFGIFVAGALRPGVSPEQVRVLRASSFSGDWRPINGRLELVAVCAVNVPGFMTPRAILASAGGKVTALIAAGASPLADLKENQRFREMEERLSRMEFTINSKRAAELLSRFSDLEAQEEASLSARAAAAFSRFEPEIPSEESELSTKIEQLMSRFND